MSDFPVSCKGGWNGLALPGGGSDRLQWRRELGTPRERHYVRVAGVAPDIEIVPFTNDLDTLLRGVCERVFFVKSGSGFSRPPRPETGVFSSRLCETLDLLTPFLPSTAPVSHQRFVDSRPGRKRKVYQQALNEIRAGRTSLEEDASIQVFVKYEKTDRTTKTDPVPRIISPRNPRYNVRVGRYLAPLEHKLFKSIGRLFGHPSVIKGYNARESAELLRGKWEQFQRPVAVGLDASRFDQHVSLEALKWEHEVYYKCYKQRKHQNRLRQLLSHQLKNECVGYVPDGRVKYTIEGTRMSGDMNTSLGNCVLMCSMIHAYSRFVGVKTHLANNGDDCVVFMEKEDLEKFMSPLSKWFLEMGFNMTVEDPVYQFDQIEFCQTKPIWGGDYWIMCRNPYTAITKDSVMLKRWDTEALFRGWLDAVGTGGLALTGQLPVFQELYQLYRRSGMRRKISEDLLPWNLRCMKEGVNREYGHVHPETRASFYWAFGMTPDEQVVLEKHYRKMFVSSSPGAYAPRLVFS